ncbi:hypothetical protein CesoFtcFv8_005899 [Champsocephalus esox]|uniref:Uncharacterized protein n=1 Tax=Champsocephalus esox TaxID=159716 RepID=A0AAN8CHK9_9TELE|nr:hypothetical protein CesoFtcFv8_005899 [Champsocephalus esox]
MLGLVGCGDSIFALGGSNRSALLDSSETLDLATLRWAPGPRLPLPLRAFACAALRGRLYLLGGTTLEQNRAVVHSGVLVYHTLTDCWTRVALDSGATCLAGGVAVRGGVCAIGGYMRDTTKFLDGNYTNLETLDATGRVLFFREGRGSGADREVTGGGVMVSAEQRGGGRRRERPCPESGSFPRVAAKDSGGGRGPVETQDLRPGGRERVAVLRQCLLLEARLAQLGPETRETPRRHRGGEPVRVHHLKVPQETHPVQTETSQRKLQEARRLAPQGPTEDEAADHMTHRPGSSSSLTS